MKEKIITKSFERLLDKGLHRGFITYEELGKSLGKRNSSVQNVEKATLIIFEKKVSCFFARVLRVFRRDIIKNNRIKDLD